jgi:hypothetical protein
LVATLVGGLAASAFRVERIAGDAAEPSLDFDVDVSDEALAEMRAGEIEATWRARLRDFGLRFAPKRASRSDAMGVRVKVVGAEPRDEVRIENALTYSARLEIRLVLDETEAMTAWGEDVKAGKVTGVESQVDAWTHERSGREHFDTYLKAGTPGALDRAVAQLSVAHPLPPGASVAYERVEPWRDDTGEVPYYRTYLVDDEVILANADIAHAEVSFDPQTVRPEVAVTLTGSGRRRFGDATAAHVGEKLAILVNGRVVSAPSVQGAIYGGRITISMGGSEAAEQERDANELVDALGATSLLPDGIVAVEVGVHARPDGIVWALRVLAALLAGAAAAALAFINDRRRWFVVSVDVSPGRERWDALAIPALVTFLVPALVWYAATSIILPSVNEVELGSVLARGDLSRHARANVGVFAIGLTPVVTAFVLIELGAIVVEYLLPVHRGKRLGTPADRRRLDRAAWILVTGLALLQSYFLARYLESLTSHGSEVVIDPGARTRWLIAITLTAGTMIQIFLAEAISRYGLANGYIVLLGAGAVTRVLEIIAPVVEAHTLRDAPVSTTLLAIAAIAAFATITSTRARTTAAAGAPGPRVPYTGLVPASVVRGGLGLLGLFALFSTAAAEIIEHVQEWTLVAELGATVPFTALILWSTPRPWSRSGVAATMAFLATLVLLPFTVAAPYRLAVPLLEGVLLGVLAAELWIGTLTRVRLPDAVSVLVVHDVFRADDAADRLRAAGIPYALLGVRARAALRFTGAFAPIAVRVSAARAAEARELLGAEPSLSPPPTAAS